jgi:hypothetical protein
MRTPKLRPAPNEAPPDAVRANYAPLSHRTQDRQPASSCSMTLWGRTNSGNARPGGSPAALPQERPRQPVLASEISDPGKFPLVVVDDRVAEGDGLSSDQQMVGADRLAESFEAGADGAADAVGWRLEGHDVKDAEDRFELSGEASRSSLMAP